MEETDWDDSMRQAFLMAAEGMSVRKILAELSRAGARRWNGRPPTVATLWRHLSDPAYAGIGLSKRTFRMGPPVVSEATFRLAQEGLDSRSRRAQEQTTTPVSTESGILNKRLRMPTERSHLFPPLAGACEEGGQGGQCARREQPSDPHHPSVGGADHRESALQPLRR